jgi:hypothetical protein
VDDNLRPYDESDLYAIFKDVKRMAGQTDAGNQDQCSDLLQEFHRNVENGEANHWQGASVSEVCFAEGTAVFVKLEEIAKVNPNIAGEVFQDTLRCARQLWESSNRQNMFPLETSFVFENNGLLVIPSGYDQFGDVLDKHGQMADSRRYPFIFDKPSTY